MLNISQINLKLLNLCTLHIIKSQKIWRDFVVLQTKFRGGYFLGGYFLGGYFLGGYFLGGYFSQR